MGHYILYNEEEPWRAAVPSSALLAVPNVTAHPSTASVPITVLLYNGPLLCGFSVLIEGLNHQLRAAVRQNAAIFELVWALSISSSHKKIPDNISNGSRVIALTNSHKRTLLKTYHLATVWYKFGGLATIWGPTAGLSLFF